MTLSYILSGGALESPRRIRPPHRSGGNERRNRLLVMCGNVSVLMATSSKETISLQPDNPKLRADEKMFPSSAVGLHCAPAPVDGRLNAFCGGILTDGSGFVYMQPRFSRRQSQCADVKSEHICKRMEFVPHTLKFIAR